jgi:hypothetical protein
VDALTRNNPQLPLHYELQGEERLGASLTITPLHSVAPELSSCIFQWHRVSLDGSKAEPIIGERKKKKNPSLSFHHKFPKDSVLCDYYGTNEPSGVQCNYLVIYVLNLCNNGIMHKVLRSNSQ